MRTSFTPQYKVTLWCLLLNSNCHVGSLGWRGQVGPPATRLAVSGSAVKQGPGGWHVLSGALQLTPRPVSRVPSSLWERRAPWFPSLYADRLSSCWVGHGCPVAPPSWLPTPGAYLCRKPFPAAGAVAITVGGELPQPKTEGNVSICCIYFVVSLWCYWFMLCTF